jgi:hypothetical protein
LAREAIDDPDAAKQLAVEIARGFTYMQDDKPALDDFALAAFHYALGRMTSIPSAVAEYLVANWSSLGDGTRETIVSEIANAVAVDRVGMDIDRRTWETVVRKHQRCLDEAVSEGSAPTP